MGRMLCCVGLLLLAILPPQGPSFSPLVAGDPTVTLSLPYRIEDPQANRDLEMIALNLVNQERVTAGLEPLMPHATIRTAARAHGIEMFTFGYLSHRSRDGRWPNERVKDLRVKVTIVGENLAYAQDVREAHRLLIASVPHRENMLSVRYRRFGIGVIDGGPYGVIVVQNFSD